MTKKVTGTIVLFKNNKEKLLKAVESFLSSSVDVKLFLVDNSPTDMLRNVVANDQIEYIHTGSNLGFGGGHNVVMDKLQTGSSFHVILNPDIFFEENVLEVLLNRMEEEEDIGIIAPKIVYPNGELQHSVRKFPKPWDLVIRRLKLFNSVFKSKYDQGHYMDVDLEKERYVDTVSGCFQVFRTEVFLNVKGFDERYFMYLEDMDICKKVHESAHKILYYPKCAVSHYFEKASSKSLKLFFVHIQSATKYFLKWGF